jgi:hypothetical protein
MLTKYTFVALSFVVFIAQAQAVPYDEFIQGHVDCALIIVLRLYITGNHNVWHVDLGSFSGKTRPDIIYHNHLIFTTHRHAKRKGCTRTPSSPGRE